MSRPKDDLEWHSDTPTKRGAYKVKSDGPSANHGWRYWDGADWGPLSSSRTWCLEGRKLYWRKSRLRYPVLWATKAEKPEDPWVFIDKGHEVMISHKKEGFAHFPKSPEFKTPLAVRLLVQLAQDKLTPS